MLSKIRDLPSLDSNSAMVRSLASMSLDESRQRPSRRRAVCSGLFVEGDVVQILNTHYRDRVKTLQEGHGEWTDAMDEVKAFFFCENLVCISIIHRLISEDQTNDILIPNPFRHLER